MSNYRRTDRHNRDISTRSSASRNISSRDLYSSGTAVSRKHDYKRIILNIAFSALLFLSVSALLFMTVFANVGFSSFADPEFNNAGKDDYNDLFYSTHKDVSYILVVGLDYSESLTDVIMVICFDHGKNQASVLQIPRDTFAGTDVIKINSVYSYNGRGSKGINALRRRITSLFGLPIDHFVAVNLKSFRNIVDAVGGVEITLDKKMRVESSTNPDNYWGSEYFYIGPGKVNLSGKEAEGFVRNRSYYALGDPGRMTAQRKFYAAFLKKVMGMSVSQALNIAKSCYSDINTDMSVNELLGYIKAARKLDMSKIRIDGVPGQGGYYYKGYDCYCAIIDKYVELANKYYLPYSDPINASDLKLVDISNGHAQNWIEGGTIGDYDTTKEKTDE